MFPPRIRRVPEEKISFAGEASLKRVPAFAHELRWGQKVLLVGGSKFRQSLLVSIFRAHGLQVDAARTPTEGRSLWQPRIYDWVLLDVHSQLPGEVIDFCEQLRHAAPEQRIAFFVGPPTYVSLQWPVEAITEDNEKKQRPAELKAAA